MRWLRFTILTGAALLLVAAVIAFSTLPTGPASAAAVGVPSPGQGCGAVGAYGYTGFGNTFEGNALGFPAGIVSTTGTIMLDGNGHWSVRETEVINGAVVATAATFSGAFTVNSDCSFVGTLEGVPLLAGVLVDRGNQVRAMSIVPGVQVNYISTYKIRPDENQQ
jgi:hypothetical protein